MKFLTIGFPVLIIFFLLGCTIPGNSDRPGLTQEQAFDKLKEAGCWYDLSDPGVAMNYQENKWVVSKNQCGGKCTINASTEEIKMDVNPMCLGVLPSE